MNDPRKRGTLPDDIAGEVRAHLARHRLSGRRAAMMLGWTQPYMSRRLTGEIPFDVADLEAIADLLDIPVVAFFQAPAAYARSPQAAVTRLPGVASRVPRRGFKSDELPFPQAAVLTLAV